MSQTIRKQGIGMRHFIFALAFLTALGTPALYAKEKSPTDWLTYKGSSDRLGTTMQSVRTPLKVVWRYTPEGKTNGFVDWGAVATHGKVYTSDGLNNVVA